MTIDLLIDDRVVTCGGTPHTIAIPLPKEVITNAVCSNTWVIWTPRYVSRMIRDSTTSGNTPHDVRSPRYSSPFLIGGICVQTIRDHGGGLQGFNKQQSDVSDKIGDTGKL